MRGEVSMSENLRRQGTLGSCGREEGRKTGELPPFIPVSISVKVSTSAFHANGISHQIF
jgi:hypothetical protein